MVRKRKSNQPNNAPKPALSNKQPMPPPPDWGALQQFWTPQLSSGTVPQNPPFNPEAPVDAQYMNNLQNFFANGNLPGLGGADVPGTFPPPFAFPGGFSPAEIHPHFATLPNMKFPMMPATPFQQPQGQQLMHETAPLTNPNAAESQPPTMTSSRQELDREEGELTDIEGPVLQNLQKADSVGLKPRQTGQTRIQPSNGPCDKSDRRSGLTTTGHRQSLSSEREEGEASSDSRASSRDSGSPYNPPLPVNIGSPSLPKSVPEAPEKAFGGAINGSQASSGSPLSLAQLRVHAQGALLSLAPHNIRYNELVGEGISSSVLKQLYEEIGIKVPTTPVNDFVTRAPSSENTHPRAGVYATKQPSQPAESRGNETPVLTPLESSPTTPKSNQTNASKPMERKEVIARMLAAKAAKSSPASAAPQSDSAQMAPSETLPATVEQPGLSSPLREGSANDKDSRIKEKNKAQTELARQRIEQLKKQGLMRNLQKAQPDGQLSDKELGTPAQESPVANSVTVHHPLPERPPLPESASVDQIPGLFMTEQASEAINGDHVTAFQDPVLEPALQPRSTQRKRPRASDFDDDPIPVPKKAFNDGTNSVLPERLVIDISDDEFYGDDEEGDDADPSKMPADGLSQGYLLPIESLPHRPAASPSQGPSASTTSSSNRNEQEDLRKKDLAIQAMHRRIAELEQRKKAKLASRTQSPRASRMTTPEMINMPAVSVSALSGLPEEHVENTLLATDADGLRKMKTKILRIQEIEAGVPSLDAEIHKSEAKLVATRREEEQLATELAKGKEGRQHLLDELNTLKTDVAGLSLDHINSALIDMETKQELPVEAVQAPSYENEALAEGAVAGPEEFETSVQAAEPPSTQHPPDVHSTPEVLTPMPPAAEPTNTSMSDTSMSEDSSSSMDESSDDSSSESGSLNEEMLDAPEPDAGSNIPADEATITNAESTNGPNGIQAEDEPLSAGQSAPQADGENPLAHPENVVSRESSVSDTYEPPEPEGSASGSESSYSPAPSPDFPSPTTNMEVSGSSEDQSQEAGEPLTEKVQELEPQQPNQHSRIGLLDNSRRPEDSQHKFSPYTSPLKMFKAYRYHPGYNDNVSGGYRSLTYSHNIDPLKYLCPYETSGGVCNDRSCEYQHFRDMALSDDKILVQMGSLREGKTTQESDQYVAGLKGTINDMRRDKVKDFNTVATEIASYRRRFLQDPTRVLAL